MLHRGGVSGRKTGGKPKRGTNLHTKEAVELRFYRIKARQKKLDLGGALES